MFYRKLGKGNGSCQGWRGGKAQVLLCFTGFKSGLVCEEGGRQTCKFCQSQISLPFLSKIDILKKTKKTQTTNPRCYPYSCWLRSCLFLNIRLETFSCLCADEADRSESISLDSEAKQTHNKHRPARRGFLWLFLSVLGELSLPVCSAHC